MLKEAFTYMIHTLTFWWDDLNADVIKCLPLRKENCTKLEYPAPEYQVRHFGA